jgi:hypothetical protein
MTFTHETLRGLLDDEIERAIERLHERIMELDRDLAALKAERDRRAFERRQRELDESEVDFKDEEYDL